MPFYGYACNACGHTFDKLRPMDERNDPVSCPECGSEDTKRTIDVPMLNFPGDGWTTKNLRVKGQMEKHRKGLAEKEQEFKRDGNMPKLTPNVGGTVVDSWADAKKLAASQGKDTASYDKKIAEAKDR